MALQMKNGTHIRTLLGMPPNNESGIDKSDPRRIECVDCKHSAKAGSEHPCNICWNPIGDMFESKAQPAKPPRTFVTCQCCKGAGEIEVSNVEHDRRPAALSQGVRVNGPVGPHTQEK